MADTKDMPHVIDEMGVRVAWVVMLVYAASVIAPYVLVYIPPTSMSEELLDIIKSNKSTVDLITTAVVMFYFGASVQRRRDQDTVNTLVKTNAAAQAALAPVAGMEDAAKRDAVVGDVVEIEPGEQKIIAGVEEK